MAVSVYYPKGTPTHQSIALLFKDKREDCMRPTNLARNMMIALKQWSNQFYISSSINTSGHKFAQHMKRVHMCFFLGVAMVTWHL